MVHSYTNHEWEPNQWKLYKTTKGLPDDWHLADENWKTKYLITVYNAML